MCSLESQLDSTVHGIFDRSQTLAGEKIAALVPTGRLEPPASVAPNDSYTAKDYVKTRISRFVYQLCVRTCVASF